MKKRTKITLRTKIYLTIVLLLTLSGVFYAANPTFFTNVPFATGVAASPDLLLVSEYCTDNIDQVACDGTVSLFAMIPGFGSCREKYMAVVPSQSAAAGFTPRDVFVTQGATIFKISGGTVTMFTTIAGCTASDHNGITFDHFGTFGNDMIVTCQEGDVFKINGAGTVTPVASGVGVDIEGPAVVPPGFGPHGGEIWVADEGGNAVHAIKNDGTVTLNILSHVSAEGVFVIPAVPCTFCSGGAFFQAEQQLTQAIYQYPVTDFTGLGGNVLVTSEQGIAGADTSLVTFNGTNYVQSSFGPRVVGVNEGSSFVDCDVPTPTPTPSPSATFTPTPTPTPTATPTATACPLTQGYWKNHPAAWPVHSLMLGSQTYNMMELLNILGTPSGGDASLILAKQLIAAKLNIANGSDPTPISSTIADADSLLSMFSGKLPYNVKPSSDIGQMMINDANTLDQYNNGLLTPGCAGETSMKRESLSRPKPDVRTSR
jgi:hypothetical protein